VLRKRHIVNRCRVTVWPSYGGGKMTRWEGDNTKWRRKCEGYNKQVRGFLKEYEGTESEGRKKCISNNKDEVEN